jgi:hypothetical protein
MEGAREAETITRRPADGVGGWIASLFGWGMNCRADQWLLWQLCS